MNIPLGVNKDGVISYMMVIYLRVGVIRGYVTDV